MAPESGRSASRHRVTSVGSGGEATSSCEGIPLGGLGLGGSMATGGLGLGLGSGGAQSSGAGGTAGTALGIGAPKCGRKSLANIGRQERIFSTSFDQVFSE